MNGNEMTQMTEKELLRLHGAVINELKRRSVVRTGNNPVGDYTEWLVSRALGLKLEDNSTVGYDATDAQGIRYQIKGRRLASEKSSRQLSAIRNLDAKDFGVLAVFYTTPTMTSSMPFLCPTKSSAGMRGTVNM